MLPSYLEARIRRPPPDGAFIVPGSTPVVGLGSPRTARVATLGLNPSRAEFPVKAGRLDGPGRRLASIHSLGVAALEVAPAAAIETVIQECETYFQRNPYRKWFDVLDEVLRAVGATYYGDRASACHLDLVQWATDPTWGRLDRPVRERLLAPDLPLLLDQLRESRIQLLLVNGNGVLRVLRAAAGCVLRPVGDPLACGGLVAKIVEGELQGVRVLGWSTNLQSSFGVSLAFRETLAIRVGEIGSS